MRSKIARPVFVLGLAVLGGAVLPVPALAQVSVNVGIAIPTPFVFVAPPQLVLLPGSSVYVVPDLGEDLYYVDGWWWRPWEGHWYRSQYRDRDWGYYDNVPSFYSNVPHDWRHRYESRQWGDRAWNYERISEDRARTYHHEAGHREPDHRESGQREPERREAVSPREAPAVRQSEPRSSSHAEHPRASAPQAKQEHQAASPGHKAQQPRAAHQQPEVRPSKSHGQPQGGQAKQQQHGQPQGGDHGKPAQGESGSGHGQGGGAHGGGSGK